MTGTKPICKFLDYGITAPREYGAYCRQSPSHLIELSGSECDGCESFEWPEDTFENWVSKPETQEILTTFAKQLWETLR